LDGSGIESSGSEELLQEGVDGGFAGGDFVLDLVLLGEVRGFRLFLDGFLAKHDEGHFFSLVLLNPFRSSQSFLLLLYIGFPFRALLDFFADGFLFDIFANEFDLKVLLGGFDDSFLSFVLGSLHFFPLSRGDLSL
jgi:hypothetical protein